MSNQNFIDSSSARKVKVTAKDFAAKMRNKQEVYHFLTHEVGAYLSSYDTMTVWHMRDLVSGKRRRIKAKEIKHLNVPQYEGLKIETFFEFAKQYPGVMDAFPSAEVELEKIPRQYVINVIYTLVGQPFRTWVDQRVNERHEEIADKKQLFIEMDPEIAEIYNNSKAVSTQQGSSFNLMKASAKRRRSKRQIEEEKKEEERLQGEIAEKLAKYEEMQKDRDDYDEMRKNYNAAKSMVDNLQASGLIQPSGDASFTIVDTWEEHQQLLQQAQ